MNPLQTIYGKNCDVFAENYEDETSKNNDKTMDHETVDEVMNRGGDDDFDALEIATRINLDLTGVTDVHKYVISMAVSIYNDRENPDQ
jgi:hypothetical protein